MAFSTAHPALRWAVPGAVVAIVLGGAAISRVAADTAPTLAPRTAAELLVDVQNAGVATMSGTVLQKADFGLPDLPVQTGGRGSSDFSSLVSGSHTLRVFYGGQDQQRLALLGTMGESDMVRNGSDVWLWSSDDNTATHYQLPARPAGTPTPDPNVPAYTPQEAADAALAAIDPTTTVITDSTATVAGRPAYQLVLTPKTPDPGTDSTSLIGSVKIAIDGEQHIPLQVQVFAKGATDPAFEVGFTQISFAAPDAAEFSFTPPPGATVTDSTLGAAGAAAAPERPATGTAQTGSTPEPTVVGTGWTSVLVATLPAGSPGSTQPDPTTTPSEAPTSAASGGTEQGGSASSLQSILGSLPQVSGSWGSGRLLQSAVFSVLLTDDGRVIAGAVTPELLYKAAAQ